MGVDTYVINEKRKQWGWLAARHKSIHTADDPITVESRKQLAALMVGPWAHEPVRLIAESDMDSDYWEEVDIGHLLADWGTPWEEDP